MVTIGKINLVTKCPTRMICLETKSVVRQSRAKRTLQVFVPKMYEKSHWSIWAKFPVSLVFTKLLSKKSIIFPCSISQK